MRILRALAAGRALVPGFGSEAFLAPWPDRRVWHHEDLTREAAAAQGFDDGAATVLAFHATYVDHYLLNPLWLASGGPARVRAARAVRADLETLHFDDLDGPEAVQRAWRRYLGGTVCALLWAAHGDLGVPGQGPTAERRTALARQAVGLGLHAVQDFASHSTWIDDPARRGRTWWEWRDAGGDTTDVVTGGVDGPGAVRHGDLGLRWRGRQGVAIPLRGHVSTPRRLTGAGAGINLDTRWQARVGARGRTWRPDGALEPDEAFDAARAQALRTSVTWLAELAAVCERAGLADLWERVRTGTGGGGGARAVRAAGAREFEDPRRRAHQLLAAGAPGRRARGEDPRAESPRTFPTSGDEGSGRGEDSWFLRIDADADARRGPGRVTSRVVGPYEHPPTSLGEPRSGVVRTVTAFRGGASDAEVRGYRLERADGAATRLRLTETWRAVVDLPDPRA
ncbi:hypothetical protein [Serinibacter arcticus]|uniref:Uncharacterized protein n=1 Tax=Serinibacter arcticus TaxID=1655435 RepID=A0A4Z1E2K9_9MICO|nr:hypothetical protein [Serinibacter arcticus]TGO05228.1 hypothetical protein SERN_1232 [Serinibacter arcticus]